MRETGTRSKVKDPVGFKVASGRHSRHHYRIPSPLHAHLTPSTVVTLPRFPPPPLPCALLVSCRPGA